MARAGRGRITPGEEWLAPGEAASLAGLRYTKRRTEFLLRRLVTKHAVALVTDRSTDPAALAGIEVRNAPSGAPYVFVDDAPIGVGVSISDRAGWAVCVTSPTGQPAFGCDLELVEPRSPGFARDFLTVAEQHLVASCATGDERDTVTNLIWSAKESALKVLRVGLRRDTRTLEVTSAAPRGDGWGALDGAGRRRDGFSRLVAAGRPVPAHLGGRSGRPAACRARRPGSTGACGTPA